MYASKSACSARACIVYVHCIPLDGPRVRFTLKQKCPTLSRAGGQKDLREEATNERECLTRVGTKRGTHETRGYGSREDNAGGKAASTANSVRKGINFRRGRNECLPEAPSRNVYLPGGRRRKKSYCFIPFRRSSPRSPAASPTVLAAFPRYPRSRPRPRFA